MTPTVLPAVTLDSATRARIGPLPAHVPLGVTLENRWWAVRPSLRVRGVLALPALDEALLAVWPMLLDTPEGSTGRVHETEHFTDVGFVLPPTAFASTSSTAPAVSHFGSLCTLAYTTVVGQRWRKTPLDQRMETVADILREVCLMSATFERLIHPVTGHPVWGALALDTWWDARIAEGHTPESARFLLALNIPANAHVIYDPDTQRPTRLPTPVLT